LVSAIRRDSFKRDLGFDSRHLEQCFLQVAQTQWFL